MILLLDGFLVDDHEFIEVLQGLQVLVDEVDVALPPAGGQLEDDDSGEYDDEVEVERDDGVEEDGDWPVQGELVEDKE